MNRKLSKAPERRFYDPGLESRSNTVARDDARPWLAKREKMTSPELKAIGVEELKGRPREKLILFVEIDGRATEAVAVITRCRSGRQAGTAQGRWRMAGVLLDPETGKAASLVVKERPGGKVEGLQPQRGGNEPSLGLSVTFSEELPFTVEETVLPFPPHRGQRVLPERGEGRNGGPTNSTFGGTFSFKDLFIDFDRYKVTIGGRKVGFPHVTTKLLFFFVRHPGRVYTREQLLDHVWGCDVYISLRNVDLHISRIRKSIEKDPARPAYIVSILGVGYKFDDAGL